MFNIFSVSKFDDSLALNKIIFVDIYTPLPTPIKMVLINNKKFLSFDNEIDNYSSAYVYCIRQIFKLFKYDNLEIWLDVSESLNPVEGVSHFNILLKRISNV